MEQPSFVSLTFSVQQQRSFGPSSVCLRRSIRNQQHLCWLPAAGCLGGLHSGEAEQFVSGWLRAYRLCWQMGLASAQVGFGSNTLLSARLTELVIDSPREEKHLHEVLLQTRRRAQRPRLKRAAESVCLQLDVFLLCSVLKNNRRISGWTRETSASWNLHVVRALLHPII